ncbi:hypothetical protein [Nocardia farcinica]|uniref:hypothetical protein n=1 Tax=Nocardia farcinica TaxID=37329 RepID=UPI0015F02CFF|nr:hypothetical protein [Nocardia farcinica]MBA4855768.1 hypothetical protein [Nocardia farcinica]MBC9815734.1 hypothetical protein [Nocardia farcinica]
MPTSENEPTRPATVAEVVGFNARRIREPHTADQMSRHARWAGLKWNSGRVADLEKGRISPTLPTLLAVAVALRSLTDRPVSLADLLTYDGPVALNDRLTIPGARLAAYFTAEPVVVLASESPALTEEAGRAGRVMREHFLSREDWLDPDVTAEFTAWREAMRNATGADERAAADLGLDPAEFARVAVKLWGHSFSAERDTRAGADASNQKRGRITRILKDELRQVISDGDD